MTNQDERASGRASRVEAQRHSWAPRWARNWLGLKEDEATSKGDAERPKAAPALAARNVAEANIETEAGRGSDDAQVAKESKSGAVAIPASGGGDKSSEYGERDNEDEDEGDDEDAGSSTSTKKRARREHRKRSEKAWSSSGNEAPLSSSSPPRTSKTKNLKALLSTSYGEFNAALSTAAAGRNQARAPSSTKADHTPSGSESEDARRAPAGVGQTLGQSVRALQERYSLRREASQTFKTMRDGSSSHRRSISSSSGDKVSAHSADVQASDQSGDVLSGSATPGSAAAQPAAEGSAIGADIVPESLRKGEAMLKVTQKKVMQRIFRLDADRGQILWESKKNNKVNLESIREVRTGADASSCRTSLSISAAHEPRWISIIYQTGGIYKALHLIALSDESLGRWRDTLTAMQDQRKLLMSGVDMLDQRQNVWLRQHWKAADASQDEKLDFNEVVRLCRRLGIESSRMELRVRFTEADVHAKGHLDFEAFQRFVNFLKRREDLEAIFIRLSDITFDRGSSDVEEGTAAHLDLDRRRKGLQRNGSTCSMSEAAFADFVRREQGHEEVRDDIMSLLFSKYRDLDKSAVVLDGFINFLKSSENAVLADNNPLATCSKWLKRKALPTAEEQKTRASAQTTEELLAVGSREAQPLSGVSGADKLTQDMTKPLSEYFISSSHNTYLVGGQWKGDSTVEGYIRALQQGARSVELDCWDGANNEPQITHGRTLTSKVPFRDVIVAIGRYAFVASPYPLILSLEVHNDLAQQDVIAQILKTTLGDKLLTAKLANRDGMSDLPSPEELKGKILVKAKNLFLVDPDRESSDVVKEAVLADAGSSSATNTADSDSDNLLSQGRNLVRSVAAKRRHAQEAKTDLYGSTTKGASGAQNKMLMSTALASLLVYTVGVKHRGINKKEKYAVEHMISISEKTAIKYARSAPEDLAKHNLDHLTRVYPSMSSIARLHASANFLPLHMWATGCQLVALNWQTLDFGFEMNQALFSRNGRCGYVLKPHALRNRDDLKNFGGARLRLALDVTVVSAQQLPRFRDAAKDKECEDGDVIDPFVAISLSLPDSWGRQTTKASVSGSRPSNARDAESMGIKALIKEAYSSSPQMPTVPLAGVTSEEVPIATAPKHSNPSSSTPTNVPPSRTISRARTYTIYGNGFNPIWDQTLSIEFEVPAGSSVACQLLRESLEAELTNSRGSIALDSVQQTETLTRGLLDLVFVRFEVCEDDSSPASSTASSSTADVTAETGAGSSEAGAGSGGPSEAATNPSSTLSSTSSSTTTLAAYTIPLGSMQRGYRHLPLHDAQLSQYLFSTLFIRSRLRFLGMANGPAPALKTSTTF
ncbi:hypothetical protein FA10DRAFT_264603 [Acaromyces ingoldii]|uniref:Phosphoinositide phospholipase C n=1 Tax=Acaromyces ingoldii TaxID=215250 RepID=A0A316YX40_9BASI|nr:hypothetical protein FA10DRAFT_264603 [Acaromyces ingoldii]PWN94007.1 hypothetical protein FA10DRAFT_264603 [Acaromyces ingoldii]